MSWSLELSTPPTLEPLTLEEVRDHCRITTTADDGYLDALIMGVRQAMEAELSKALLTQTRKLRLNYTWPGSGRIHLPRPPLQSITSVAYLDADGASQTLGASLYQVVGARTNPDPDAPVAYITPAYGQSWPSVRSIPETITVTYVCGWTARGYIPQSIRQAMLVAVGELYEQRETTITGTIVQSVPTIERLVASERCYHEFGEDCG